jgi:hypothetical protein
VVPCCLPRQKQPGDDNSAGVNKMLKWVRFCGGKFRSQNEASSNIKMGNLSGSFAQLLRYTSPADARSTIVRLRSAETASPRSKAYWGRLAFEQNSSLKKNGAIQEWIYWTEKVGGRRRKERLSVYSW